MIVIELVYLITLIIFIFILFYWFLCRNSSNSDSKINNLAKHKKNDDIINCDDAANSYPQSHNSSISYEIKKKLDEVEDQFKKQEKNGKKMEMQQSESNDQNAKSQQKNQIEQVVEQKSVPQRHQPPQQKKEALQPIQESSNLVEDNSQSISYNNHTFNQRALSRKQRERKRLETVKNHYKKIIEELKYKLEDVCCRNNESMSMAELNETFNFTEEQSMISYQVGQENYFMEVKAQEINNLKQELQFHEQCVTNLLEEDQALKDKLKTLEQENKKLKNSLIDSGQKNSSKQSGIGTSRVEKSPEMLIKEQNYQHKTMSPIKKIYASQIIPESPSSHQTFPFFGSRIGDSTSPSRMSTISMMSIVEGVMSIGLLGECRSLNEINKKFIINQIKKILKKRIVDAELIYSTSEQDRYQRSFPSELYRNENILILAKLSNGIGIGIFVQVISQQNQEPSNGSVAIFNLSKRKTLSSQDICIQNEESLIIGKGQLSISSMQKHILTVRSIGTILSSNSIVSELFGNQQTNQVIEHLDLFVLYPSQ